MIQEAITALKERSGSSQIAIAKHIESNHVSQLPQNFKKQLLIQLKKLVVNEKLVKVKNSYKLAPITKSLKTVVEKKMMSKETIKPKDKKAVKKVVTKKLKGIKSPVKKLKSIKSPVKKKVVAVKK